MSSSARVSPDNGDREARARDGLIEHVAVAGATRLDQRVFRCGIGFGLEPDASAHLRVVREDIGQLRQLVGLDFAGAIALVRVCGLALLCRVHCALLEIGQGQLLAALEGFVCGFPGWARAGLQRIAVRSTRPALVVNRRGFEHQRLIGARDHLEYERCGRRERVHRDASIKLFLFRGQVVDRQIASSYTGQTKRRCGGK